MIIKDLIPGVFIWDCAPRIVSAQRGGALPETDVYEIMLHLVSGRAPILARVLSPL